jgi:hypothetical protein
VSEEVILADEIQTGVFYVIHAEDTVILLNQERARELRDRLNEFLGADKQPATTGIKFPRNSEEPDLPLGTKLLDDEGDTLERVEGGWSWHTVDGVHPWNDDVHPWEIVSHEHSFTVIA